MDAFLLALFLSLILASGGKGPLVVQALRARFDNEAAIFSAVLIALAANVTLSLVGGAFIARMLTPEARNLFFAMALGAGGAGLLITARPFSIPAHKPRGSKLGAFFLSGFAIFRHSLGDGAQFLIAGLAASRAIPGLAGAGGWIGCVLACLFLPALFQGTLPLTLIKALRIGAAIVLMLFGFVVAMHALRLA